MFKDVIPHHIWTVWLICAFCMVAEFILVNHGMLGYAFTVVVIHGFALWLILAAITNILEKQKRTIGMAI